MNRLQRVLLTALLLNVLNTGYLSWRYVALHARWVTPGTGLCSWTRGIDCDRVLMTPQARAFWFPNALLGLGFSLGCLVWWLAGKRLGAAYQHHVIRTLVFWLGVSAVATLWFFWLLVHLDALCPFCPWHHVLIYISLAAAWGVWRRTPAPAGHAPVRPLAILVGVCVGQFLLWPALWAVAFSRGTLLP
ncbi:MAG: vitamin K epoxide reductase family protein [Planctomycetes bacterium]|nr:vitamin K epoxide reductase family protein [Planctomycetota bacterium]